MKTILSIILGLALSLPASAWTDSSQNKEMSDNLQIAERFCSANTECINLLALELDDAYRKGQKEKYVQKAWHLKVNKFTKELSTLCDTAPNKDLCEAYRVQLLSRYIQGLN